MPRWPALSNYAWQGSVFIKTVSNIYLKYLKWFSFSFIFLNYLPVLWLMGVDRNKTAVTCCEIWSYNVDIYFCNLRHIRKHFKSFLSAFFLIVSFTCFQIATWSPIKHKRSKRSRWRKRVHKTNELGEIASNWGLLMFFTILLPRFFKLHLTMMSVFWKRYMHLN